MIYWWKNDPGLSHRSTKCKISWEAEFNWAMDTRTRHVFAQGRRRFSSRAFPRMSGKDVALSSMAPYGPSRIFNAFFPFFPALTAFSARTKWGSFAVDACQTILTLEGQACTRDNFARYILMRSHTAGRFNHRSPGHKVIARIPKELIKTVRSHINDQLLPSVLLFPCFVRLAYNRVGYVSIVCGWPSRGTKDTWRETITGCPILYLTEALSLEI